MKRLLIDVSSVLRACHHAGKDPEGGRNVEFEGQKVWVNSGEYAYELFLASYSRVLRERNLKPVETVLVLDGRNSRELRQVFLPEYKANRPPRPPEMNQEYSEAQEGVIDEITALGGLCCVQERREADDLLAYLSQNLQGQKLIWSRDGDLVALRSGSTDVLYNTELNPDALKSCPVQYITLYKALVGDTSDNFKGAKGFGDKAFLDMLMLFGFDGLDNLTELIKQRRLDKLKEDVAEFKPLQRIIDSAESVYTSWACAQFYPGKVNTYAAPMEIRAQAVVGRDDWYPGLASYAPRKTLVDTPQKLEAIKLELYKSKRVALDIETSTGEGSDAWCQKIIEASKGRKRGYVDVYGSELTGMSLTFGDNMQHTVYMPVDHRDSTNLYSDQVKELIGGVPKEVDLLVQNNAFELPVLYNEWGGVFIDGVVDTRIMANYVDENRLSGLKPSSKHYLGYTQETYAEATTFRAPAGTLPPGGKPTKKATKKQLEKGTRKEVPDGWEERSYKMRELTSEHVFNYACDDTICTAALYNRYRFTMELEGSWSAFCQCELEVQYITAQSFVDGIDVDFALLDKLEMGDAEAYEGDKQKLFAYLRGKNWEGTVYHPAEDSVVGIKQAFLAFTGKKLKTRFRKVEKVLEAVREQGAPELAAAYESGDPAPVEELLIQKFTGEPVFEPSKDAHLAELMYEVMGLPVRFRTIPTALMKQKGKKGTPQVDVSAVDHAIALDVDENSEEAGVLLVIRRMKQILTRQSLYYRPFRLYAHWKDGKLHPDMGQSKATTRRFTPNSPNLNQLPKRGEGSRVRRLIKPPPGYAVVTMDFSGQELRHAAAASQDANLLSCYMGGVLKDPHSLTGAGIAEKQGSKFGDYDLFIQNLSDPEVQAFRDTGKGINFSSQYLCQAPKLAKMLIISVEDAQTFLDAKNEVYSGLADWQQAVIKRVHETGYAVTRLGARRHLYTKISDSSKYVQAEAERQAVNFEIQSPSQEQTKLSMISMMGDPKTEEAGVRFAFPVHDEVVLFVPINKLIGAIQATHPRMVQPYADVEVPFESEIAIGTSFGTLKKVGVTPDADRIVEVAKEIWPDVTLIT